MPRFVLDENGYFGSNTMYFIPKRDLFLLGLLNSKVGYFYFKSVCAGLEGKNEVYLRFFGQYLEEFPVPSAEVKLHDRAIDTLVYQLYNLTPEEIHIVEG